MSKLIKKNEQTKVGADTQSAPPVLDAPPVLNKYVFLLESVPDGECNSALLDEHGEIPLHFVDKKVEIDIPKSHYEQTLLINRFTSKHFKLLSSPRIEEDTNKIVEVESNKKKTVDYWIFQHTDRTRYGDNHNGKIAVKVNDMLSEAFDCVNGVIKVSTPDHARALRENGFVEVTVQYKD